MTSQSHGTTARYHGGCRCADCTSAMSDYCANYRGQRRITECSLPGTTNSRCQRVASDLAMSEAAVARVARLANRSPKHFAKYADELAAAKAGRAQALQNRDDHMAECPAAADRFGASA